MDIRIGSAQVRKRRSWVPWVLSLVTLGVYGVVYWYKINREMRDASASLGRPLNNNPWLAVLAVTLGGLVIVPAILSVIHTARRVRAMEQLVAPGGEWMGPSSPLTVVLALIWGFHTILLQSYLNRVWDIAAAPSAPAMPIAA